MLTKKHLKNKSLYIEFSKIILIICLSFLFFFLWFADGFTKNYYNALLSNEVQEQLSYKSIQEKNNDSIIVQKIKSMNLEDRQVFYTNENSAGKEVSNEIAKIKEKYDLNLGGEVAIIKSGNDTAIIAYNQSGHSFFKTVMFEYIKNFLLLVIFISLLFIALSKTWISKFMNHLKGLFLSKENESFGLAGTIEFKDLKYELENKENELNDFIDNISHDLKTPVTAISLSIQDFDLSKNQKDLIINECDTIRNTIESLKGISKYTLLSDQKTCTDPSVIIKQIIDRYMHQAQHKNIYFVQKIEKHELLFNEELLYYIFENYINNAMKYALPDEDGDIIIEIGLNKKDDNLIFYTKNKTDISISDVSKVFNMSFRGDKTRKKNNGTGIGLALVKRISESNNDECYAKLINDEITFSYIFINKKRD